MKNRIAALVLLLCAAVLPAVAANVAETIRPQQTAQIRALPSAAERELIRKWASEAVPLTADELRPLDNVQIPPSCDYSKYVTFIRNQGQGGCGTMTTLAILDILKEKERP